MLLEVSIYVQNIIIWIIIRCRRRAHSKKRKKVMKFKQKNSLHLWVWLQELTNIRTVLLNLILVDQCIVDYSVEIPTRCSFVIEFIIPKFFKGSTCFERHTAHHQELQTVFAASGLYAHMVTGCCQGWVGTQCWAFKKLCNNKFYYKAASSWYFYWVKETVVLFLYSPSGTSLPVTVWPWLLSETALG